MRNFQELLVAIIAVIAIALFLAGCVWRLFRGDPHTGRRR